MLFSPFMYYLMFTVLLCGAIILIFDVFNLTHKKRTRQERIDALFQDNSKPTLSKMVSYYHGKKDLFFIQEAKEAKSMLSATKRSEEYQTTILTCVLLACLGAILGFVMGNILAIPVLALAGFMAPLWRLKLYRAKYRKYLMAQLESSVSLITASYMRQDSLVDAIEENIQSTSDIIRPYFEQFLAEHKINANVKLCIHNLQDKIDDSIFSEWCDCLMKTYDNSDMKENLLAIAEKYSAVRIVQDELDTETSAALLEYLIMLAVMVFVYPLVYLLNKEWFSYYATIPGKICIAYTIIVGLYAIKKLVDISAPVEFKR